MSQKRAATSELHPENWDDEEEPVTCGTFRVAPVEELKGRVIKRARRKLCVSGEAAESGKATLNVKGASGGGGAEGSEVTSSETSTPKSLFGNFQGFMKSNSLSGTTTSSTTDAGSPFRFLSSLAAKSTSNSGSTPLAATSSTTLNSKSTASTSASPQGFTSDASSKSIFAMSSNKAADENSSKEKPAMTSLSQIGKPAAFSIASTHASSNSSAAVLSSRSTARFTTSSSYYSKLRSLNQSVSDWIKQHVDKNPLCILTPIFSDYEQHLKEIENERTAPPDQAASPGSLIANTTLVNSKGSTGDCLFKMPFNSSSSASNTNNHNTTTSDNTKSSSSPFKTIADTKSNGFSFGLKKDDGSLSSGKAQTASATTADAGSASSPPSSGFSFGLKANTNNTNIGSSSGVGGGGGGGGGFSFMSPFGKTAASNDSKSPLSTTGFRFGNVAAPPSSGGSNAAVAAADDEKDDDQPPKAEFKQVVEEDAVFSKKCKVFVKKENNFADKGVGTLYLKPIEGSEKTQLIVRADTNLGNILLNLILNDGIPTKRTGKNNVMMVCVPTPDIEKATAVLLRVKTGEEADELLKAIDEHKK